MGSFIACWLPFFILYSIGPICPVCHPEIDPRSVFFYSDAYIHKITNLQNCMQMSSLINLIFFLLLSNFVCCYYCSSMKSIVKIFSFEKWFLHTEISVHILGNPACSTFFNLKSFQQTELSFKLVAAETKLFVGKWQTFDLKNSRKSVYIIYDNIY